MLKEIDTLIDRSRRCGITRAVVMGDFNEDMNDHSQVVAILRSNAFKLGELKKTVSKERSSIQYQINKMSKKDYTAKNGIFTNYERVD